MATPESFAALLPSIEPLCPKLASDLSSQLALPDAWAEKCPRLQNMLANYTKTQHPTEALAQTLKQLSAMVDSSLPNTRKPNKSKNTSKAGKNNKVTKNTSIIVPDTPPTTAKTNSNPKTKTKTEREQMLDRLFTIIREYNQAHAA